MFIGVVTIARPFHNPYGADREDKTINKHDLHIPCVVGVELFHFLAHVTVTPLTPTLACTHTPEKTTPEVPFSHALNGVSCIAIYCHRTIWWQSSSPLNERLISCVHVTSCLLGQDKDSSGTDACFLPMPRST